MNAFCNMPRLFEDAFVGKGMTQEQARISILGKLEKKWSKIKSEEIRELVRPKYEAAMLLLAPL